MRRYSRRMAVVTVAVSIVTGACGSIEAQAPDQVAGAQVARALSTSRASMFRHEFDMAKYYEPPLQEDIDSVSLEEALAHELVGEDDPGGRDRRVLTIPVQ